MYLFRALNVQLLVYYLFDRETVRIPAEAAWHVEAVLGLVTTHNVFYRSSQ